LIPNPHSRLSTWLKEIDHILKTPKKTSFTPQDFSRGSNVKTLT
jgi:hypothetical protein